MKTCKNSLQMQGRTIEWRLLRVQGMSGLLTRLLCVVRRRKRPIMHDLRRQSTGAGGILMLCDGLDDVVQLA